MHILLKFAPLLLVLSARSNGQEAANDEWVSPCPRLFVYEGKQSSEPDKWYGILTLLSETDLQGIWLRVVFDKPSLQLGNWFGQVVTNDNKDYLIKNRDFRLKAHTPQTIRFFVKYDANETPPKLQSFRLNARTVCPEGLATEAPPPTMELQTSNALGATPSGFGGGRRPGGGGRPGGDSGGRPEGGGNEKERPIVFRPPESTSDNEDFFPGDFYNLFNNRPTQPSSVPGNSDNINDVCGTVVAQATPLITFGQPTREGEFPWHAALYHTRGIDLTYICGASLISKFHVITVAHCVTRKRSANPLNPDNLIVYLGKYYLKRFGSAGLQDRQVSKILPHPQYDAQTYSNDIALLKFLTPAEFTDYVRPICLWAGSTDSSNIVNKLGKVVGWGFDETGKVTETLMQAKMPVVRNEICLYSYPDFYARFTNANTFCAGFQNGTSVCNGDSGGGMVFPKGSSGQLSQRWQLRGLVSISVALQNQYKCDTMHYVVFTDAAKYSDWIRMAMKV